MGNLDSRVLLAASCDWTGAARLPEVLARAGIRVSLLHSGAAHIAASSHLSEATQVAGGAVGVADALSRQMGAFDRVICLDEPLIEVLCELDDQPWVRAAMPAGSIRDVRALVDKTLFAARATTAGLPRPECEVVWDLQQLYEAMRRIGAPVMVKGPRGQGGATVRAALDGDAGREAAAEIGCWPLLLERAIVGPFAIVPGLFSQGRLVAGFVGERVRDVRPFGPSSLVHVRAGRHPAIDVAERVGEVFGLDGFASLDVVFSQTGEPLVVEVNPRPVPTLRFARRAGVDFGRVFADVLAGRAPVEPVLPVRDLVARQFPQELQRFRRERGGVAGTLRWAADPRDWRELPWGDRGLLANICASASMD
jgi:hypothetical protein